MSFWNKKLLKVYGGWMLELMLVIFCNIIKGENIIKERFVKEREEMGDFFNFLVVVVGLFISGGVGVGVFLVVFMVTFVFNEIDVNEVYF